MSNRDVHNFYYVTLLWDLSVATISPVSFIRSAIAVVFPPGAAHMSMIRSPGWGSKIQRMQKTLKSCALSKSNQGVPNMKFSIGKIITQSKLQIKILMVIHLKVKAKGGVHK